MAKKRQRPFDGITPAYDVLLRGSDDMPLGLCHLYMATAKQLCRPHYSMGSIKAVSAKLRKLADNGYVQIDTMPTKLMKSPYIYTLGGSGVRYLQKAGIDVGESFRASREVNKSYLFIDHTLELNDILIAAATLKKDAPNYWLDSFIHERTLKRRPYKAQWQGGSFSLIPDAFLDFRHSTNRRMPVVVEHDRGSEEQQYFRRRIRAYIVMLRNEGYRDMFGVGSITIAFSTSVGLARLNKMRDWTRQELELTGDSESTGLVFCFTHLTNPLDPLTLWLKPSWYTLFDNQPISLLGV